MAHYTGEITRKKMVFFSILLMVTLVVSYYLFVSGLDKEISRASISFLKGFGIQDVWGLLSRMGEDWFQILVSVSFGVFYYKKCHYKLSRIWYSSIVIYLLSGVLVQIMKFVVARPRPKMLPEYDPVFFEFGAKMASWPSGHTMTTFAWLACLMPFYGKKIQLFMFVMACAVGYSRVGLGSHYLSDVISGAVIGYIFGMLMREKFKLNKEVV